MKFKNATKKFVFTGFSQNQVLLNIPQLNKTHVIFLFLSFAEEPKIEPKVEVKTEKTDEKSTAVMKPPPEKKQKLR